MARKIGSLQQEKNGMWTARVRVGGVNLCRSTGTTEHAEAEAALARLVVLANCRRKPVVERAPLVTSWPRYAASPAAARLSPNTRRTSYRAWLHFSVWLHGVHPEVSSPCDVTRAMAEEYLAFFQTGHAPVTCNLRICILRAVFRAVLECDGREPANPWDGIRRRTGDGYARRELTLDEVRRLLAVSGSCGREWRTLFSLAIYTGMRLGDCCRLTWESVNMSSAVIQMVPHKTRRYLAGRYVTIPLHPELAGLLQETPPELRSGFVLNSIAQDFTLRRWIISRRLERIFRDANIETSVLLEGRERKTPLATFHSLRHTFVSIAVNAGVSLATVQSIVGHTSTAMTRHYYHPSEDALRHAVGAIPPIGSDAPPPSRPRDGAFRRLVFRKPSVLCARLKELAKARERNLISADEFMSLRRNVLADA